MALEPLRLIKNWFRNTATREANWDEIADKLTAWAYRVNNNLKQIGLDLAGSGYDFNNNGVRTQTNPVVSRIEVLEAAQEGRVGVSNVALDLSVAGKIKLVQANGDNFSTAEPGKVTVNSSAYVGELATYSITESVELILTGCHWGFGTLGDLSDVKLYLFFMDTGAGVIFGVDITGGRRTITPADAETVQTSVTTAAKVFCVSEPAGEYNCFYFGYVLANFDDTGNAGGEDFWTIQSGVGDINLGRGETESRNKTIDGNLGVGGDVTVTGDITLSGQLTGAPLPTGSVMDLGLDISDTTKIKLAWKDGTALSASQVAYAIIPSTTNQGQILKHAITAAMEVTLTGAHWGLGTTGDQTDYRLYVILIDSAGTPVLGVTPISGLTKALTANCVTTSTDATTVAKILCSSAVGADSALTYVGWVHADFDDTGNGGGEDFWTVQTALGDINLGSKQAYAISTAAIASPRNVAVSSSDSATDTVTSTSYTDVANLTVTLTTTGRPVVLALITSSADEYSTIEVIHGTTDSYGISIGFIKALRDSTRVGIHCLGVTTAASTSTTIPTATFPPTAIQFYDFPPAGTYVYKIQAKTIHATYVTIQFSQVRLLAYEL